MNAPEFYIPVEPDIKRFVQHLRTHHRTILSAGFGDGKSFFLDKFEKDREVSEEFKLIKLYPINYQVVENTDIYSLLKYDIMLQLLVDDMVSESPLKGEFLDVKDGADFVTALFDGFSKVDPSPKARIPAAALRVLKSISGISEKRRIRNGGKRAARTLLEKYEKSPTQYGQDLTTQLIKQSLTDWKEKTGKKVVLVVEDLDRLDPAHLFRILNVFSAHMDFIYRNGEAPADSLVGSRFGFDSIVFVLEYGNLKRLFSHFYGDDHSFSGYINKFMPQGFFEYSLRKSSNSYLYQSLSRITGMEQVHISGLLNPVMNNVTIRDMAYAVKDLEKQVAIEHSPNLKTGFLMMIVAMLRLGMKSHEIVNSCDEQYKKYMPHFAQYVFDFTYLDGFSDEKGLLKVSDTSAFYLIERDKDGYPILGRQMSVPTHMRIFDMRTFVYKLFDYILP